jgi:hypothetical protein
MIKGDFIKFKVTSGLKQNYSNLGYDFSNEEVEIKVTDLKRSSQVKIIAICDLCNDESEIIYSKYNINLKRNGIYSCKKCGLKKRSLDFKNNNLSLNKDFQDKKIKTFLKKYGVDNPSKSEQIKDKKSKTTFLNYGVDNSLKIKELMIEGMIRKYGVEYPLQSDEIKNKMVDKLIINYGVDNVSKIEDVKIKKIETCLKNYGVEYPSQSPSLVLKQNKTYKENHLFKYGVSYPMQRPDIFKKQLLTSYKIIYYNDELFSQGSYELDFLNYCENNSIIDLISNGPSIEYILESNNTNHTYHSDFFIENLNLIIEIKSTYTYNIHLDKNLMKRKYSKLNGYNFIFIIDKDYTEFGNIINQLKLKNPLN